MVNLKDSKNKNELIKFKKQTLEKFDSFLNIKLKDNQKICASIVYWIDNYIDYLEKEKTFSAKYLPIYKYGSIIDVNLGFNVGNELGGKHYCVVLNKNDNKYNKLLTVVPLSSIKPNKTKNDLHESEVYLGTTIYDLLAMKYITEHRMLEEKIEEYQDNIDKINERFEYYKDLLDNGEKSIENRQAIEQFCQSTLLELENYKKSSNQTRKNLTKTHKRLEKIKKLKNGSYARCSQITTISKMKIFDPKNPYDALIDIQLSKDQMKKISLTISKLYLEKLD